jgi:hypothetical protein
MSRNGPCDHPRCSFGPCRQLTAEELKISPKDEKHARALIRLGYKQTSGKYRALRAGDVYLTVSLNVFRAMKKLGLRLWIHDETPFWRQREQEQRKPFEYRIGECGHVTRFS